MPLLLLAFVLSWPLPAPASDDAFVSQAHAVRAAIQDFAGPAGLRLRSEQEWEALLELLRDPDPSVRVSAARSLRNFVAQREEVRTALLGRYRDETEDLDVRHAAAKTLSVASLDSRVRENLLDYARRGSELSLRVLSYKALYFCADSYPLVRQALLDAVERAGDKRERLGAIWGLFSASANSEVRRVLVETARRGKDQDLRVEALKSLYKTMLNAEAVEPVYDMARDGAEEPAVRYPCILLLSAVGANRTRELLAELARRERDPRLREAAITAMNPSDERILRYFHLGGRTETGRILDPLESE
ncbi:MAG: hypothetical protein A2X37_08785 [Elusimicrobia bacterium GWA2_66_18]|nr:MAG: hypothetical protein A2X37_08785 [Elusimicrobia bacterium GWA2_66_18]